MSGNKSSSTFASSFPYSVGLNGVKQQQNLQVVHILISLLVLVILFTLFLRWSKIFISHLRHISVMANVESQRFWSNNRTDWWPWMKKHFLYAPLWKRRHNEELQLSKAVSIGTLPGRGHFVLMIIYALFNIGWILTLPYHEESRELIAALRGRAGVMAVFNLFPTIVFALRNNPLIRILHVPFDTFQLFHRWAARIFIIESVIHVGAWFANTRDAGGWDAIGKGLTTGPQSQSFAWGLVGAIAALVVLVQSWSPLRHGFYETFLAIHKLFVFLVFLGILLHLRLDKLSQAPWMIIIFLIWIYDYLCRAYRIFRYNFDWNRGQYHSKVFIEALDGEACRLTFHLPNYWKPRPGAHVHVYLPTFSSAQSHPFSIAWADVHELPSSVSSRNTEKTLPLTIKDLDISSLTDNANRRTSVSLICRARTGFTRDLYSKVNDMPESQCWSWGFVEGFYYGSHDSLSSYSDVLLFAGGVGITHQIMFAKQLLKGYAEGSVAARRIQLVWSCPDKACLEWVRPWMNEILNMPGRREALKILLFVTRQRRPENYMSDSRTVSLVSGRCNVQEIVDRAVIERSGALAVTVCGPGAFADSVRDAVRKRVKVGVVDFVEEAFTY
jgi:Ferric reductase like transmembrane component/Ferric reductase NAD binding domain/FAD-binding domain